MKKFIDLVKKYKIYILSILFLFYFFKSCSKSTDIKKLTKEVDNNGIVVDSLNNQIKLRQQKIDSFPEADHPYLEHLPEVSQKQYFD